MSSATYCSVEHHNRNVQGLGNMYRYSLCKPFCIHCHDFMLHVLSMSSSPFLPFDPLQESRDPRKLYWLFEMLMESPVNGEDGSFVDAWSVKFSLPGQVVTVFRKPF